MQNKEAVHCLNGAKKALDGYCELNAEVTEAFRLAVEALERPVSGTVRVASACKDFNSCSECVHAADSEEQCILRRCIHAVHELRECYSPQPKPRKEEAPHDEKLWSGLWSEPEDDRHTYGEKLYEGDTIYLLGVEGTVRRENGAWGWASAEYVPWKELEAKLPHNNSAAFCYCDNFVSFWELKWNFDDGEDWDGVPFIRHHKEENNEDH